MRSYDVRYLPIAENDLNEIVDYFLEHSNNAAGTFIDELERLEKHLSMFPESAALVRNKRLRDKGYRMAVIDDYLLFYIIHGDTVYIMRIIHGKRNYKTML